MGWMKNRGAFTPGLDDMTGSFYEMFGVCWSGLVPASYSAGSVISDAFTAGSTTPDTVFVGCSPTYSMPTDHSGTTEYVTGGCTIPTNWDATTDFRCIVWFAQAAAETTGEKYVWNLQHIYVNDGDLLGSYVEVAGTLTLGASGTTQYAIRHCEFALPYRNALGTAERGGPLNFKLHRKILGTTGEALLMGVQFGYWGTGYSGTVSGTLQSKLLVADRA